MLTLLTVNYRNYDLLNFQLDHMSKLEGIQEYRLIVVENTPKNERARIKHARISDIAYTYSSYAFDGVSHGHALDLGLGLVDSEFVFIFDTDFFILKRDFFPVFIEKMQKERYDAIGPEFFDGRDWKPFREKFPDKFSNLPTAWGTIYRSDIAKSETWIVTHNELAENQSSGFVDVGWRLRKTMIDRGKNTLIFEGYQRNYEGQGNCYFRHEGEDIGFHYMRASYDRMSQSVQEIKGFIS